MKGSKEFPPSPEIKRVIHAVQMAGIEIGSIEIEPDGIRTYSEVDQTDQEDQECPLDRWKAGQNRSR